MSHRNETFHSLFLCYPDNFGKKKIFFSTPLGGAALLGGEGNPHFGGLGMSDQNETFHSLFLCYPANFGEKKFFFDPPSLVVLPY